MKAPKINKNMVSDIAGLAIGSIAASKVANLKLPVALPAPIQSALPLIVGVLLYKKTGILGSIAKGMIAAGAKTMVSTLVPSLGIGTDASADSDISDYMIEGAYALAGATESSQGGGNYALAGMDARDGALFG